jgi:hypothetical protein
VLTVEFNQRRHTADQAADLAQASLNEGDDHAALVSIALSLATIADVLIGWSALGGAYLAVHMRDSL